MKVTILGKRMVDYKKKDSGQQVLAAELYVAFADERVEGQSAGTVWVPGSNEHYHAIKALDVSRPVSALIVSEIPPGGQYARLTTFEVLAPAKALA